MEPLTTDPIERFHELFQRASTSEPHDHTRAALATADARGRPSVRYVLVKTADRLGFYFFTNYDSRKGHELAENPYAALAFHWPSIGVQVRVEGRCDRLPEERSDAYFASRPRGHQLGAWASHQSEEITSREVLLAQLQDVEARYAGTDVERPPHWGGYVIVPERIELWFAQDDRLHDRIVYDRLPNSLGWAARRLSP